jgi:hypothetical protein
MFKDCIVRTNPVIDLQEVQDDHKTLPSWAAPMTTFDTLLLGKNCAAITRDCRSHNNEDSRAVRSESSEAAPYHEVDSIFTSLSGDPGCLNNPAILWETSCTLAGCPCAPSGSTGVAQTVSSTPLSCKTSRLYNGMYSTLGGSAETVVPATRFGVVLSSSTVWSAYSP